MCNNERINELLLDYEMKDSKSRVIIYTKQIELLEYQKYLIELGKIYNGSRMIYEVVSLLKDIEYFDKCFAK